MVRCTSGSSNLRPMRRFTENTVFSGLVTACLFATCPTSRSPFFAIATMEGVRREPSLFSRTVGSPASMTATTEFVVPRSMPITFAIVLFPPDDGYRGLNASLTCIHWRCIAGHNDLCRANDAIPHDIAGPRYGDNGAFRHICSCFHGEGFMPARIK